MRSPPIRRSPSGRSGRPPPYWRPFRLKKINAVSLLKETFETRVQEGFSREKEKYQRGLVAMIDDRRLAPLIAIIVPKRASSSARE